MIIRYCGATHLYSLSGFFIATNISASPLPEIWFNNPKKNIGQTPNYMNTDSNPIVVEQTFNVPIGVVWKAISDVDQMRRWFFGTITNFVPEPGFRTQFNVRAEDQDYLHMWKVTEVIPERKLSYSWQYGGYPGDSLVTWELLEISGGAKLTLTHEGIETFPQDNPIFTREACQEG